MKSKQILRFDGKIQLLKINIFLVKILWLFRFLTEIKKKNLRFDGKIKLLKIDIFLVKVLWLFRFLLKSKQILQFDGKI